MKSLPCLSVFLLFALAAGFATPVRAAKDKLFDNFEAVDWAMSKHDGTELSLDRAKGKTGKALKVTYDLKDTRQWVQLSKPFSIKTLEGMAFNIWLKGEEGSNTLEVKLIDEDGSNFGFKKHNITAEKDWTLLSIEGDEFSYWWGGEDKELGRVREVYFAVSAGAEGAAGGTGVLYLDEMTIGPVTSVPTTAGVLSTGESTDQWELAKGEGVEASFSNVPGVKGKALQISYEIPENQWVAIRLAAGLSLNEKAAFTVHLNGKGASNNIEFKLVDRDGSTFGKVLEGGAETAGWTEVKIPVSEMTYFWGGDDKLNRARVTYIDIAISGAGGKGTLALDELVLTQ